MTKLLGFISIICCLIVFVSIALGRTNSKSNNYQIIQKQENQDSCHIELGDHTRNIDIIESTNISVFDRVERCRIEYSENSIIRDYSNRIVLINSCGISVSKITSLCSIKDCFGIDVQNCFNCDFVGICNEQFVGLKNKKVILDKKGSLVFLDKNQITATK